KPGITTGELDRVASTLIKIHKARPAFLGFRGFPASICTSVNDQIVHGIPGNYRLREGDIISLDFGVIHQGYYSDMAITLPVGDISENAQKLIAVTESALANGISQMVPGNRLYDISSAIQECAESNGFSVVRDLVGHGIGQKMHEEPQIPNFGKRSTGPYLKAGMVFALEPMVNMGGYDIRTLDDNWTVVTADGSLSCHFEHTVAITDNGPEILTQLH
ncbi:MAG: type I methionyl aminopeptidase, partial [Elusimicrobiota bacterium]|nr:type I methionyl aminopeptidase [Elusimicrobiota bacterium]